MTTSKKKILVFIDWYLPGFRAGGPIRSCANMIEHLRDEYEFSVVTRDTDYHETVPYKNIQSDSWNILFDGTRVYYFSKKNLSIKNIKKIILEEQFDKVYINGIFSFYFSLAPLYLLRKENSNVIVAVRGMLAKGAMSVKKTKKILFLFFANMLGIFDKKNFQATNEQEQKDIVKYFGYKSSVKIAPNLPKKYYSLEAKYKPKENGSVRIVSIARVSPEKNIKFSLQVLSHIKGNVQFDIFGTINNEIYWNECKKIIVELPHNISVNYKGAIPSKEINSKISEYHFMLMPSLSENFGHVIIESLMAGTPVIISDQTMWKNLSSQNAGWDLPLDKINDFVSVINSCIQMSDEEYQIWCYGAVEYSKKYLSDSSMIQHNKLLFK